MKNQSVGCSRLSDRLWLTTRTYICMTMLELWWTGYLNLFIFSVFCLMSDSTWRCWCTIVFALNLPCRSVCANWCQNLKIGIQRSKPRDQVGMPCRLAPSSCHAMPVGTIIIKLLVRRRQNSSAPSQIYKLESKNPRYSLKLEHIWFTCTAAKACMLHLKAHNRVA